MKKLLTCLLLIGYAATLSAQEKTNIIYRDTINLSGYVYNELGKPMKYLYIESTQLDPVYNSFKAHCYTDTNGFFQIKGAILNDTLKFKYGHATYYTPDIYNKDSRYMVIYLAPKINDINSATPVEITHARKYPKITPALHIKILDHGGDYFEVHKTAEYPGGSVAFEDYLKNHIRYPEEAVNKNIEGTVQIAFVVEKDGSPVDIKVLRGIGYGCDQEVINVLRTSPKWKPAIDNGRPWAMHETVSVKFSLRDK